jgi:hypothetical protein
MFYSITKPPTLTTMTNDELQTQLCHDLQKLSSRQALDTKIKQDNLSASKAQLRHAKWLAWEKAWDRQQEAEDNYAYAQEVQKACPCPYYATHVLEAEYTVLKRAHSVRRAQDALCVCCKGSDLEEFCCKQIAVFESWGPIPPCTSFSKNSLAMRGRKGTSAESTAESTWPASRTHDLLHGHRHRRWGSIAVACASRIYFQLLT